MAYSHNAPFRADVVGSYLRPAELKAAREDFAAGKSMPQRSRRSRTRPSPNSSPSRRPPACM